MEPMTNSHVRCLYVSTYSRPVTVFLNLWHYFGNHVTTLHYDTTHANQSIYSKYAIHFMYSKKDVRRHNAHDRNSSEHTVHSASIFSHSFYTGMKMLKMYSSSEQCMKCTLNSCFYFALPHFVSCVSIICCSQVFRKEKQEQKREQDQECRAIFHDYEGWKRYALCTKVSKHRGKAKK